MHLYTAMECLFRGIHLSKLLSLALQSSVEVAKPPANLSANTTANLFTKSNDGNDGG